MPQHQDRNSREAVLLHISRQFEDIAKRVSQDVTHHAASSPVPAAVGFVLYFLRNSEGEPLKDTTLVRVGITMKEMEETEGFANLVETCKLRHLTARLEEHFYSQQPVFTRIYKVVVDGWS
ncbi:MULTISPECIES: hypothetical protein [Oceanibaculum]|uniref:Uncharacterized protein n=1 Tax=Oceanibaculum indicum P24 TaxID=1207063 RepID=K2KGL1_9PROT|nr:MULTISPECIES: hypothetical protein [Oceanibaculum]EKE76475.1 hypothetical protein P24_07519 [Oceanibaculum indicum P24]MCH2393111.1 hypothetical protein [Oceanibaculum sp.]